MTVEYAFVVPERQNEPTQRAPNKLKMAVAGALLRTQRPHRAPDESEFQLVTATIQ